MLGVGIALYGGARLLVAPRLPDVGTVPAAHPSAFESTGVATLDSAVQPTWLSLPEQGVEGVASGTRERHRGDHREVG